MASISVLGRGFPPALARLNAVHPVPVSRLEYVRAALTLGFQNYAAYKAAGREFALYRRGIVSASGALLCDDSGNLRVAPVITHLDPTEKGMMSFWQGMIFSKIIAARLLNVPWLIHLDTMLKAGTATLMAGSNQRGDCAGVDTAGAWHVIESKGRSSSIESGLITHAKTQAANVRIVGHPAPSTTSACVSCLWSSPIEVILDDPPASDAPRNEYRFSDEEFFEHYYGEIAAYIRDHRTAKAEKGGYLFAEIDVGDELGEIGLPDELIKDPRSAFRFERRMILRNEANDLVEVRGIRPEWPKLK